jgi:hypothetical protein
MSYEWRIFLPLVDENDLTIIGGELYEEYLILQNRLLDEISIESLIEERIDKYVVSPSHYGLKARGGKKGELKLRLSREKNGSELWEKIELG